MKMKATENYRMLFDSEFEISEHEINSAAIHWKLRYTELGDLPARFRQPSQGKARRIAKNSQIENTFQEGVKSWTATINLLISRLGPELAWRIVSLNSSIEERTETATQSQDFLALIAFMALRRDVEHCSPEELGCLTGFSCGLQWHIEKTIRNNAVLERKA